MKKLIVAAMVVISMCAVADESAAVKETAAPVAAARAKRPQLSNAQREELKARREKLLAERKARQAEIEKKMIETIKKYGLDDEKAKALMADIQKDIRDMRRPMMPNGGPKRGPKPTKQEAK